MECKQGSYGLKTTNEEFDLLYSKYRQPGKLIVLDDKFFKLIPLKYKCLLERGLNYSRVSMSLSSYGYNETPSGGTVMSQMG